MQSWQPSLKKAYSSLSDEYRAFLEKDNGYFPSSSNYFNAFKTLAKTKVKYILFGQDPYPREQSAGGYAFIDENVKSIFSSSGLSKEVNRATSLRNLMKMLLVARGDLDANSTTQDAIQKIDKNYLIDSIKELRLNFEKSGVLLLNTALIFTDKKSSNRHIKEWRPFMQTLLNELKDDNPKLILFGTHAKELKKRLNLDSFETIEMEHPYNQTFISNKKAQELFGEMRLLEK